MEWIIGGGGSGYHPKVSHIWLSFWKGGGTTCARGHDSINHTSFLQRAFKLVQPTTLLTQMESSYHTFKRSMCMESPVYDKKNHSLHLLALCLKASTNVMKLSSFSLTSKDNVKHFLRYIVQRYKVFCRIITSEEVMRRMFRGYDSH